MDPIAFTAVPAEVQADDCSVVAAPDAVVEPTPMQTPQPHIWVNAESITPSEYDEGSSLAKFDVVLMVSCSDASGKSVSKKIVKTIAFDKIKLSNEIESMTGVTIVETANKQEKSKKLLNSFREMAGIPGKGTFV